MSAQDMNQATPLLQIQDLDIRFRVDRKSEPFQAVKGISFDIPVNSTVALVGESGSGKSVSAMAILGLGVPIDMVSWGTMLGEAQSELVLGKWWQLAAATAFMATFVTAFALLTDALRDAMDPKLR